MVDCLELKEAWGKRFDRTIIPCIVLTIFAIPSYSRLMFGLGLAFSSQGQPGLSGLIGTPGMQGPKVYYNYSCLYCQIPPVFIKKYYYDYLVYYLHLVVQGEDGNPGLWGDPGMKGQEVCFSQ